MSIIYRYGNTVLPSHDKDCTNRKRVHDPCEMCDAANVTDSCDKCGSGVCDDNICRLNFPHKHNTRYIVCATCVEQIDKKLIPLIDLGKLKMLKLKIKNNCTSRSPRSSSIASSSESSISSDEWINCGGITVSK